MIDALLFALQMGASGAALCLVCAWLAEAWERLGEARRRTEE